MKKIFTLLAAVMLCTMSANARLSWDFRSWSAATLAALEADMTINGATKNWRNYESDATKADKQHYWVARKMAGTMVTNDGSVDKPIKELEGLNCGASNAKKFVVSYNHSGSTHGTSFVWLNGKNETITVPNVVGGTTLHIAVESHSATEARGVNVTFNDQSFSCVPVEYTEYDLELNEGQGDLVLKTTNGCHIYYIILGAGDAPETSTIGCLYYEAAGAGFEELPIYKAIKDMENVTFTGIKVDEGAPTAEQLQAYDAVILDSSIPADGAVATALKGMVQWQPTLCLNPDLAVAFGYGTKYENEEATEIGIVPNTTKSWFSGVELEDVWGDGSAYVYGLTTGDIMPVAINRSENHATDDALIYLTNVDNEQLEGAVVAYSHNPSHNAYAYYGATGSYTETSAAVLKNILNDLVSSKSPVEPTVKCTFKGDYKEMESTITINNSNKNAVIYYTTDGTEPTVESAVYTEPLVFTSEATVKAVAIADGYTLSEVADFEVKLYHQAKAPVIAVSGNPETEDVVVTITSEEGADIYYNFNGGTTTNQSSLYQGPITLKNTATITAVAIGNEEQALVLSEPVTQKVYANALNVRRDQLAAFNPTVADWGTPTNYAFDGEMQTANPSSTLYYFSWGKNPVMSFETVGDPKTDEEGNPITDENGNFIYDTLDREASVVTSGTDSAWKLVSQGQVMIYQVLSTGSDTGNGEGYNPARAEDLDTEKLLTSNDVQCGGKASGDKYTARIESTAKYAGPFNVLTFVGTSTGSAEKIAVQVSEDGINWETVGDTLACSDVKRLYKKHEVSYNDTKEVFVRVAHVATGSGAQIYNIYVMNHGENSIAMEEAYKQEITGIEEFIAAPAVKKAVKGAYNLAGQKVNGAYKGIIILDGKVILNK